MLCSVDTSHIESRIISNLKACHAWKNGILNKITEDSYNSEINLGKAVPHIGKASHIHRYFFSVSLLSFPAEKCC